MQGIIKAVKIDRGFGFIEPAERGEDLFFHCSALVGLEFDEQLYGRRVEFDEELDRRSGKLRACNIRPA